MGGRDARIFSNRVLPNGLAALVHFSLSTAILTASGCGLVGWVG